jgi:hypothetical protein
MATKNKIVKGGSLIRYSSASWLRKQMGAGMPKTSKVGKYRAQRSDAGKKRK